MPTGNVKWFDSKKGFGFIVNADGKDVFVHYATIEGDGFRTLADGETVEYEEIKGENKNLHRVLTTSAGLESAAPEFSDYPIILRGSKAPLSQRQ